MEFLTLILVLCLIGLQPFSIISACMTTSTISSPTVSPVPTGCCPPLVQTLTPSTAFADGVLTFQYDNNQCRGTVLANCSQPNPTLELNAAIVVNQNNFLVIGPRNVTFGGTCDGNGNWLFANPPLTVQDIECLLTNPT